MTKPTFKKGDMVFVTEIPDYADPDEVYGLVGVVQGYWKAGDETGYIIEVRYADKKVTENIDAQV